MTSPSPMHGGSQHEEKLAYYIHLRPLPRPRARWLAGRGEGFDYNTLALSLSLVVDVQQFIRCQIARSILYCSIIIVGPSEEAKSQVQGSHEYELLNLPKRQRAKRKAYRSCRPSTTTIANDRYCMMPPCHLYPKLCH